MPATITPERAREAEGACVFANLETVVEAATNLFDTALAPAGISVQQLGYLVCLHGLGEVDVESLARRKCKEPSRVRAALVEMQTRGWMQVPDRDDRPLVLTDAGQAKLAEGAALWGRTQEDVVTTMGGPEVWARTVDQLSLLFAAIMSLR